MEYNQQNIRDLDQIESHETKLNSSYIKNLTERFLDCINNLQKRILQLKGMQIIK